MSKDCLAFGMFLKMVEQMRSGLLELAAVVDVGEVLDLDTVG